MDATRGRYRFGPLFYGTVAVACSALAGLGLWSLWPAWRQSQELRTYASQLRGPSPLFARRAAEKLAAAGPAAVPWLTAAASDRDAGVRSLALSTLGRTLPASRETVEALVAGLRDGDARVRREAADALGRFGPDASTAAEALAGALDDGDPGVRLRAARALWRIGGKASALAPPVLLSLVARAAVLDPPVRLEAIETIRKIGGATEAQGLSALVPLIDHEAPAVRREAIECLERLGPRAGVAIPALVRVLGDEDRLARCRAALALSEIEGWKSGRARSALRGIADDPTLSAPMREQVRWVLDSNLVNGSEFSQPVHVLRHLVWELQQAEDRGMSGTARPSGAEPEGPE